MPIYEYVCEGCSHQFEKRVPSSQSRVQCPECRSRKVVRQFSAFAFKGERGFVGSRGSSCAGCTSGG
ncbi:MAG: zinc ribbon domain-containing protein [Candidatus Methylomirabilota bacterium]